MNLNQKAATTAIFSFLLLSVPLCAIAHESALGKKQCPLPTASSLQAEEHLSSRSQSHVIEDAMLHLFQEETPVNPPLPASESKSELPNLKDEYSLSPHPGSTGPVTLAVRRSWETHQAGIYINNKEVLHFRSTVGGYTPYERAKWVTHGLYQFLESGGNPRDLKPGLDGSQVVIRTGDKTLLTVDLDSAKGNHQTPQSLAQYWTNLLREALGAPPIVRHLGMVASRGLQGPSRENSFDSPFEPSHYRASGALRTGIASWYGPGFHGRRAANGSRFNMYALTAAHRTLPFGTLVRVLNHRTGKSCVVKITDRGPFHHNRMIDLSKGAASAIGLLGSGVGKVSIEILKPLITR